MTEVKMMKHPGKHEPSLLIVEDNESMREFLLNYLGIGQYDVMVAKDGPEAIRMVKRHKFDVAIIDLRLPGKSGVEVLEAAKKRHRGLKPIIITAYPSVDTVAECTKLGALDYLTKPFSLEELDNMLEEVMQEMPSRCILKPSKKEPAQKATREITSLMEERRIFHPSPEFTKGAVVPTIRDYKALYNWSIRDPESFWTHLADQVDWYRKWHTFCEYDFKDKPDVKYFIGGKINVCHNCLDRHLGTWRRNKAALIWQGVFDEEVRTFTYQQLHREVCRFANVLKKLNVKKGDVVTLYMPMIPELVIAVLACARIGAIHSVVFGGFSAEALKNRITDCGSKILVIADGYHHGPSVIHSKDSADQALSDCPQVEDVIVVKRQSVRRPYHADMKPGRDRWWHEEMAADDISDKCDPEIMDADAPLFILYTSGSTGKPKGIVHGQAGYLLYTHQTMKWIFDLKDEDIFWCTADIGWVTGHSYVIYGPLSNGATTLIFEGVPTWPKPDTFWKMVDKFKVNIFYTAPTAIRALMRHGEEWPAKHDLSSLRLLGSVGEPINPEAWVWYYDNIGGGRCPLVDTWWQTETGGILITPLPSAMPTKPGSASLPFPGIEPVILDKDGQEVTVNEGGFLCIKKPWPGMMQTIYGDPEKFKELYFSRFPGKYFTSDGCRIDEDGYYWLMGRIDDVINISGHRLCTAEVESALVAHEKVSEAAVVGIPDEIKGQGIYAFVTLNSGVSPTGLLTNNLRRHVRNVIGPIATPKKIQFTEALPKTRSGKIMRRLLEKIACGDTENLGDTSTLADPSVVQKLIEDRH